MLNPIQPKGLLALAAAAALLASGACSRVDDGTTASRKFDTGAAKTDRSAKDATAKAGTRADEAAESAKSMGAAGSSKIDDATITTRVNAALAKDKELSAIKIDVDTQDGVVTLSGPAPTASVKARAAEIARGVKGVDSVNNQLTIKAG